MEFIRVSPAATWNPGFEVTILGPSLPIRGNAQWPGKARAGSGQRLEILEIRLAEEIQERAVDAGSSKAVAGAALPQGLVEGFLVRKDGGS